MKKFILITVAASMAVAASAQVKFSRTFGKKESNVTWFVRAGVNFNSVSGDIDEHYYHGEDFYTEENGWDEKRGPEEVKIEGKTGFDVSFGFNKPFGKSSAYWGMELGIGSRGYSATEVEQVEERIYDADLGRNNYRYTYCDGDKGDFTAYNVKFVPFMVGYKYGVTKDIKIDAHIGAFVSYDFAISGDCDDVNGAEEEPESLDAGMQLGIGAWYKRFNLDLTWQKGFLEYSNADCYADAAKHSAIMLRVGVAF